MAETPEPEVEDEAYVLDDQVGYLLRLSGQRHTAIFQALAPLGLTPTQFSALVRLAQMGPCSQNELGRRTAMDVATIKGVVDRLRKKGMVEVVPDAQDKRRSILSIAPAYAILAADLFAAGHEITHATMEPLSTDEQAVLVRLLKKISGA